MALQNTPPKFFRRLLRWFCRPAFLEELEGDLEERFYQNLKEKGSAYARRYYRKEVLQLMRPSVIKKPRLNGLWGNPYLLNYHFKIARRNLAKHRLFSFINIFGLAIGMSTCLLIVSMVMDLLAFDSFHEKKDRIYRIISDVQYSNGRTDIYAASPLPLAEALGSRFPNLENHCRIQRRFQGLGQTEGKKLYLSGYYTDASFFELFSFQVISGDPRATLAEPFSVVLTQKTAEKFFGNKDPIGASLEIGELGLFQVGAVLADIPKNSHLQFELLGSFNTLEQLEKQQKIRSTQNNWDEFLMNYNYLLLAPGLQASEVELALNDIATAEYSRFENIEPRFELQPLKSIMPGRDLSAQLGPRMPYLPIVLLSFIALSILISACFNYTNLSMARALRRTKEVGIRKVMGARRGQVFMQFITEAILLALLALLLAYPLYEYLIRPQFVLLVPRMDEYLSLIPNISSLVSFLLIAVVTGLMGGLLPALFFSRMRPVKVLKNLKTMKLFQRLGLRKALNVFQFVLSLFFVVSTLIILQQYRYIFNREMGFEQNNILNVELQDTDHQLIKNEFESIAGVETISLSSIIPGMGRNWATWVKQEGQQDSIIAYYMATDENYRANLEIPLISGVDFQQLSQLERQKAILINEQFVKTFGYSHPQDALDQWVNIFGKNVQIKGVVRDFHYANLEEPIRSFFFSYGPEQCQFANLKIHSGDMTGTMTAIQSGWQRINPVNEFSAQFFEEQIELAYEFLLNIMKIFGFLGFLAISIACLGLLGMAIYTMESRSKEIGIRKVFGAQSWQLIFLVSSGFIRLLVIASLIALPLSYLLFDRVVLNNFSYRVSISSTELLLGVLLLFVLGMLTIGSQTWKAAAANPARILRDE